MANCDHLQPNPLALVLIFILTLIGCGGGNGDDNEQPPSSSNYFLFYGDNNNLPSDGLFKVQAGQIEILSTINPNGNSQIDNLTAFGEKTVFVACGIDGCEPWITDGTSQSTWQIKNINPTGDSAPQQFIEFNGAIYFTANDGRHGRELWRSDGTEAGTAMVKNIGTENPEAPLSPVSSNPQELTVLKDRLYFAANDGPYSSTRHGTELWKTDGTETGTVLVKNIGIEEKTDINPQTISGNPQELTVFNNAIYFRAYDGPYSDTQYGTELWKTDGTEAGTLLIKNIGINPDRPQLLYDGSPQKFHIFGGEIYFFADDGEHGFEPWKTNGTIGNAVLIKNIGRDLIQNPSDPSQTIQDPFPTTPENLSYWTAFSNKLFFTANDRSSGLELWFTDGTSFGTDMLKKNNPDPLDNERTIAINPDGPSVVANREDVYYIFNNQLVFFANDGTNGFEPWVTDGTPGGTRLLEKIWTPVPDDPRRQFLSESDPASADNLKFLISYDGLLHFSADNGISGVEIFVTDGVVTEQQNAFLLVGSAINDSSFSETGIGPGDIPGYRESFAPQVLDNVLYFPAFDGRNFHGTEIWRSRGFTDTKLLEDLNPGPPDGVL